MKEERTRVNSRTGEYEMSLKSVVCVELTVRMDVLKIKNEWSGTRKSESLNSCLCKWVVEVALTKVKNMGGGDLCTPRLTGEHQLELLSKQLDASSSELNLVCKYKF